MSIITNAKEIADLIQKMGDVELYRKIVELEGEIVDLTREKRALEEQNEELKRSLEISKEMKFKEPFYFTDDDPVPFCPKCWEVDMKAVHMLVSKSERLTQTHYVCPNCKTSKWI